MISHQLLRLFFPPCQVKVSRLHRFDQKPHPPLTSKPNRKLQIEVGTAPPQQRAPAVTGHRRTPGPQPQALDGSQWAPPDPQPQPPELSALPDFRCQIECQKE